MRAINDKHDRKYRWKKTSDFVNEMNRIGKVCYYLRIISQRKFEKDNKGVRPRQIYAYGKYVTRWGMNWWHPLAWLLIIGFLLTNLALGLWAWVEKSGELISDFNSFDVEIKDKLKKW